MNKRVAVVVAAILLLAVSSTQIVDVAEANWVDMTWRLSPITDAPVVTVESPTINATYLSSTVLNFTVTEPLSWVPSGGKPYGGIRSIDYLIDGEKHSLYTAQSNAPYDELPPTSNFNVSTGELSNGLHTMKLIVVGTTIYWKWSTPPPGAHGGMSVPEMQYYTMSVSNTISFSIIATPKITVLLEKNQTYNTTSLPLEFKVNEPVSWIGYSLNGDKNATVAGNTTLTGISDGSHSIVVYANDSLGNMGKSDTVFFTVNTQPSPSPTLSPSNSATQQPTLQPTQSANPTVGPAVDYGTDPLLLILSLTAVAIVAIAAAGIIVYNKKFRK